MRIAEIFTSEAERVESYCWTTRYGVIGTTLDGNVLIAGEDDHGWTLDGYVLPRLASGLMPGREIMADGGSP
jgi:hypothetical protein